MSGFPTDPATLVLLAAACRINPDNGQTNLLTFLDMGSRVKTQTLIDGDPDEPGAVYVVEYEPGFEPWSPQSVILALIAEIERLRELENS